MYNFIRKIQIFVAHFKEIIKKNVIGTRNEWESHFYIVLM